MNRRLALAARGTAALAFSLAFAACGAAGVGADAERLFAEQCASCHGDDGRGAPARRGLEPRLDLSRSILVANRDTKLLFQRIAYGYNTMPGFAHKLSQGELEGLAEYVLELAKPAD